VVNIDNATHTLIKGAANLDKFCLLSWSHFVT